MRLRLLISCGLCALALAAQAQTPAGKARDALLDALLWAPDRRTELTAYSPAIQTELRRHLARARAYRSKREAPPTLASEYGMVYTALVAYERRLAAVSGDPRAPALAAAYVESLHPCYEWEGYHDCPEREAVFAVEYQAAHPNGPFSQYLPLLAAHRWLCAAEGYDYEKQPDEAARSRKAYEEALAVAKRSTSVLIRSAAEGLAARGRCNSPE
jgi:hypothetical protein